MKESQLYDNYEVNYEMYWSGYVKVICGIYCVLSLLGSLILGIRVGRVVEGTTIPIILAGLLNSALIGSTLMLLCEMGDEICDIKSKMVKAEREKSEGSLSQASKSYSLDRMAVARNTSGETWKCPNCGRKNDKTDMICKDCGTSK